MPETKVVFFKDKNGNVPVLQWLNELLKKDKKAYLIFYEKIKILKAAGHEIRRPHADFLRDKIYELRTHTHQGQYRILYFYHGLQAIILSHGIKKEKIVPLKEIERAIGNREMFLKNPDAHWHEEEVEP